MSDITTVDETMQGPEGLGVKRPISILYRDVEPDIRGMFSALGKGVLGFVSGGPLGMVRPGIDFVSSVSLADDVSGKAWNLITLSLTNALLELTSGIPRSVLQDFDRKKLERGIGLEGVFDELNGFEISPSFFQYPKQLPLLEPLKVCFANWLEEMGLSDARAQRISLRLPSYFAVALHNEWAATPHAYEAILKAVNSPFHQSASLEKAWASYRAQLQREPDEPVFGGAHSLKDLYISLRAWRRVPLSEEERATRRRNAQGERSLEERKPRPRQVVDAEKDLYAWVQAADRADALRLISGGPGHGKSTLTRILAAQLAERGSIAVLRVPLHRLDRDLELEKAIDDFARGDEQLSGFALEDLAEPLLLIFDGLDELEAQGEVGARVAKAFADDVIKLVGKKNRSKLQLMALLTGRTLVVDAVDGTQEKAGRVLHLFGYSQNPHEYEYPHQELDWRAAEGLLEIDQRALWWDKYARAEGAEAKGTPEALTKGRLDEITRQPLLNYLVSLRGQGKGISLNAKTNLNHILDDLLCQTFDRTWGEARQDKEETRTPALKGVEFGDFVRFLEEVALASWQRDGRATPLDDVVKRCQTGRLKRVLESLEAATEQGVLRLMTAFYFRKGGSMNSGTETFEFAHKSFREYLTAKALLRKAGPIIAERLSNLEEPERGWSSARALAIWLEFVGSASVDPYLLDFLQTEARNQHTSGEFRLLSHERGVEVLCALFKFSLERGPDLSSLQGKGLAEALRRVNNAEVALLALLSSVATAQAVPMELELHRDGLGLWLRRVGPHPGIEEGAVSTRCLSRANLSGAHLSNAHLSNANLSNAHLSNANLIRANLSNAHLSNANLIRANLSGANLSGANLSGANLSNANLIRANLSNAHLSNANLSNANLNNANLSGAHLSNANLRNAKLSDADLSNAHLSNANLSGARLSHASLFGATLSDATLSDANLIGADLGVATLSGATLSGANLSGAHLSATHLIGANLRGAHLIGANLRGTDLSGVDLTGANFDDVITDERTQFPEGFILPTPPSEP